MADRRLLVVLRQDGPIPLDVRLECQAGDTLVIFGPSGSGKTTVLRAIAGLYAPASAEIRAGGETWTDTARGVFVPPHRRHVGYVFQEYALFPHLTALGNVEAALTDQPRGERRARALACLAQVHLDGKAGRRPHELSGGERQRVALARALARQPAVLLLDEPFSAVDRAVRRRLQDEVADVRATLGVPTILVTHDLDDVVRLASHVLLLDRGRAIALDTIATLMRRPDLPGLVDAAGPGTVFDAVVHRTHADRGVVELAFDGGMLVAAGRAPEGATVRARIPARDVILATSLPDGLSVQNVLAGAIRSVTLPEGQDAATVDVAVGGLTIAAEVTRDAVQSLALAPGRPVYALVKAVSVEVTGAAGGRAPRS
ncbi:MAG: molybdenum ABC transporter ATP-binding protein [Acidobacteria bacterium]|nr:molybdenum ABC transporter ATP-binding protein [Acidobacteriota bacterium]